ncbi:hypothetical protein WA171_004783 [Blastocystis sp. BT1]
MLYPLRYVRRRLLVAAAKKRLAQERQLNLDKTKKSNENSSTKHVSFSGKLAVCSFDQSTPPIASIIRRPSRINDLTNQALKAEADRLNLTYTGKRIDSVKQEIMSMWKDDMRTKLMSMGIEHSDIDDETIESFYNFVLSIKRSTDLVMAGESLIPQIMTNKELHAFMASHALNLKYNASREACIQAVETYMVEHLIPVDSMTGDLSRRHLSAVDVFNVKYPFCSSTMLRSILKTHQIDPPKTLAQRRQCVIELIDKELKEEFLDVMVKLLEQCLHFYGVQGTSSDPNILLRQLYTTKLQNHEVILEETD